jgi:hypothetical protein
VTLAPARVQTGKVSLKNRFARQRQVNRLMHLNGNGCVARVIPLVKFEDSQTNIC